MVYLWAMPENFLNRDIGEYNRDISPDRFLLTQGRLLDINEFSPMPIVNFEVSKKEDIEIRLSP